MGKLNRLGVVGATNQVPGQSGVRVAKYAGSISTLEEGDTQLLVKADGKRHLSRTRSDATVTILAFFSGLSFETLEILTDLVRHLLRNWNASLGEVEVQG